MDHSPNTFSHFFIQLPGTTSIQKVPAVHVCRADRTELLQALFAYTVCSSILAV